MLWGFKESDQVCAHTHTHAVIESLVLTHKTSVEDRVHLILFLYKVLKEVAQNGYKKGLRFPNMLWVTTKHFKDFFFKIQGKPWFWRQHSWGGRVWGEVQKQNLPLPQKYGKTFWLCFRYTWVFWGNKWEITVLYQQAPTWYFRDLLFLIPTTQTGFFKY